MLPLGTAEIHQMRDTSNVALAGTAVISTPSWAADGQGGSVATFAASGTVDARLAPISGTEQIDEDRYTRDQLFVLTVPALTTVTAADRVAFNSNTYEVTHVAPWVPWEIARRVRVGIVS